MLNSSHLALVCGLLLFSCGQNDAADLCKSTFEPYPDLISGRVVVKAHEDFLEGMALYQKGAYAEAAEVIRPYAFKRGSNKAAHLYLANCYLAMGQPYDAEMHLNHLRDSNLKGYTDPVQWYTVVCWVCSDQQDRALVGAHEIVNGKRHTYRKEAQELVKALQRK